MAVATAKASDKYLNVSAGTPITSDFPLFETDHLEVYYGNAAILATIVTHYTLTLAVDYTTFTITPTAALITAINNLIAADATESNFITVRRVTPATTSLTPSSANFRTAVAGAVDRAVLSQAELSDRFLRTLRVNPAESTGDLPAAIPAKAQRIAGGTDKTLVFDGVTGNPKLGLDPTNATNAAVAAQAAAETAQGLAEDAQTAAETAQGLAEDAQAAAETAQGLAEDAQTAAETAQGLAEDAQAAAEVAEAEARAYADTIGWRYTYDGASTTDADPGAGAFRFNDVVGSATELYIDNVDALGRDVSAYLDSLDDAGSSAQRGVLTFKGADVSTAFLVARVTGSVVAATGYRRISLTVIQAGGTWTDGHEFLAAFSFAGQNGTIAEGTYGDIEVSGVGSVWTIGLEAVTYAKFQDAAGVGLLGAQGAGAHELIAQVSAPEIAAGTETELRAFSPADVAGVVVAHAPSTSVRLVAPTTLSSVATWDFAFDPTLYRRVVVYLDHVLPDTDGVNLYARVSTASPGTVFDSGATHYRWTTYASRSGANGSSGSSAQSQVNLTGTVYGVGSAAHEGVTGTVTLFGPSSSSDKRMRGEVSWITRSPADDPIVAFTNGIRRGTGSTHGFRLLFSSGNISSGTVYVEAELL